MSLLRCFLSLILLNQVYASLVNGIFETSQTVPSIKVSLEPPAVPYPDLAELSDKFEKERLVASNVAMQKLESEFDRAIVDGKKQLLGLLDKKLMILLDKSMLQKVANAAESVAAAHEKNNKMKGATTFAERLVAFPALLNQLASKLQNLSPPSFSVELLYPPGIDSSVISKVQQIEQSRTKKMNLMFKNMDELFDSVNKVLVNNLGSILEIQLSSFTADLEAVKSVVGGTGHKTPTSFAVTNPHQLNVAVAPPDRTYPTVTDFADDINRRRTNHERVIRIKMLQLIRAQVDTLIDLVREELHNRVGKSLSLLAATSSAILEVVS